MANLTAGPYKVTAGEVLVAATGLAVALALAWISLDLFAGGRLTMAVSARRPRLRVVPDVSDGKDGAGEAAGN